MENIVEIVKSMSDKEIIETYPSKVVRLTLPDRKYEETDESSGGIGYSEPLPENFENELEKTFGDQVYLDQGVYSDWIKRTWILAPIMLRKQVRELLSHYFSKNQVDEEVICKYRSGVPTHIVLRSNVVKKDWKLHVKNNNGRKVLATEIYPKTEIPIEYPEWYPGNEKVKAPVYETGIGGIEVSTFNHKAGQEKHKHLISTEIYTVLEGIVTIVVDDIELLLTEGDELIILPGTVHEVLTSNVEFLVRVHTVNCYGDMDKYVQIGDDWCQVLTLNQSKKDKK
jgi:mannose-6-phosphate isomerase-like protein (cupin superfamily)